jgi:hypothetical protein
MSTTEDYEYYRGLRVLHRDYEHRYNEYNTETMNTQQRDAVCITSHSDGTTTVPLWTPLDPL